jgi:tRNA 2-thiouridine synthesizing protein B
MLHTVNKSPFERTALASCLRYARDGDAILLYEDGVYAARKSQATAADIKAAAARFKLFVLGPDLEARGIATDQVIDGIRIVDYGGFVDLAAENGPVQAWL